MRYKNKNVAIFGMGKSGLAAARKLLNLGARISISEKLSREQCDSATIDELKNRGVTFEFGGHTLQAIVGKDLVMVSPGIHLDLPILKEARKHHILVVSEIELAFRFLHKPIIAVTGTNGKTTTTTLIFEMLKAAGKKVALAGNIGIPLITIDDRFLDFVVAEISSYQLELIIAFRPWISVLLNITPDHMERYKSMEEYAKTKARIFLNQGKTDFVIYNERDKIVSETIKASIARKVAFGIKDIFFDPAEISLKGKHNIENIMAASIATQLCGVPKSIIKKTLKEFSGVPHRIEFVKEVRGVSFYNDSKATNPDSTIKAIEALSSSSDKPNVILILGGLDKGLGLEPLIEKIKKSVREVVLIGSGAVRFNAELVRFGFTKIHFACNMQEAVEISKKLSQIGDQVLLSPACASFDMFANFEVRGEVFKSAVLDL